MSSTERYRKTGEAFDTLELVFSKNPLNNDNVIETITVFDPKTVHFLHLEVMYLSQP